MLQADQRALQRVAKTAQRVIGCELPSLDEVYTIRLQRKARSIIGDVIHPGYPLFDLLHSGRRYRTIQSRTNRLRNSFYPRAVASLNAVHEYWD